MRTDAQLVYRMRTEDALALEALYRRYHRLVRWVARKHLRIWEDCEEVVQDVFWQVWRQARLYDPLKANVRGWILHIAYTRTFDKLRSVAGDKRYKVKHSDVPLREADRAVGSEGLLDKLMAAEALGMLKNERQRRAVRMRINGWDIYEVAQALNDTVGNGRHHYTRGISKMRELLEA